MLMPSAKTPWLARAGAAPAVYAANRPKVQIHLFIAIASLGCFLPSDIQLGGGIMPTCQLASRPALLRCAARRGKLGRVEGLPPAGRRKWPAPSGGCGPQCD